MAFMVDLANVVLWSMVQPAEILDLPAAQSNRPGLPSIAICSWILLCLMFAGWKRIQGQSLRLGFFFCALLPVLLLVVIFPEQLWQPWRETQFDSALTQRLDATISVVFGIAAGVLWARLAATSLYPNMDLRLLRNDEPTCHAMHLIGSLALAGSFLGWQTVTLVGLLTGIIGLGLAGIVRATKHSALKCDWSIVVWSAMFIVLLVELYYPHALHSMDGMNPAFRYTLFAVLLLLLAKLHVLVAPK